MFGSGTKTFIPGLKPTNQTFFSLALHSVYWCFPYFCVLTLIGKSGRWGSKTEQAGYLSLKHLHFFPSYDRTTIWHDNMMESWEILTSLPWFDSITFKIPMVGGIILKNLGFKSLLRKVIFLSFFKFSLKNWIFLFLTIFWYLVWLFRNQIKHVENICFYWYLIC